MKRKEMKKLMEILRVENLSKVYGKGAAKVVALDNVSFSIAKGEFVAIVGASGSGKSTLINALFQNKITEEGLVSKKNKRGKNTTTISKLYELEEHTYIADTPGFSSFAIDEIPSKELDQYFIEFKEHISACEFIGCHHIKERKCGIKDAIAEGKIAKERYDRYCRIYEEIKEKEEHQW